MPSPINALIDACVHPVTVSPADRDSGIPYVTHTGILELGEVKLTVHVLNTGQRVMDKATAERFLGCRVEEILAERERTIWR
jgi:hypothetical protein